MNGTLHKIEELGAKYTLRIEQWKDKSGAWRVGLNWYSKINYLFICEKSTLSEAIDTAYDYHHNPMRKYDK